MPSLDKIAQEAKTLAYSFIGAVGSAAVLAGLNWIGAHIPEAIQFVGTVAGAYGTAKKFG